MSDEFYVGYLDPGPGTARRMKRVAAALVVMALGLALAFALATGPFDRAEYEYGTERMWEGTIETAPRPVLIVFTHTVPGAPLGTFERYPLVAQGKHGADEAIAGLDGAVVRLKARRILRKQTTMLEIVPGTIERVERKLPPDGKPAEASQVQDLGPTKFDGEIVDAKCFLGVMNPGRLEVHRACAIRCIAGGIPPMLFVQDGKGGEGHLLLVDAKGKPLNDRVLDVVATPLTVEGRLERRDDLFYLYAESWRRK